jgi:hypothetical protein
MISLYPTWPTLHEEVEQEFAQLQLEMIHCDACGDYHPPELHIRRPIPFDIDDEPAEA